MEVENNLIDSVDNREPIASFQSRFNISDNLSGNLKEYAKTPKMKIFYTLVTYLLTNVLTRPDFIAYDHLYVNNISRRVCKWLGALSVTYTVKSVERYEEVKNDFDLFIFDSCILK